MLDNYNDNWFLRCGEKILNKGFGFAVRIGVILMENIQCLARDESVPGHLLVYKISI